MLLVMITSIYCAPTMCSALCSVSGTPDCIESSPLGVTGMVHIVHFIDEGMKLTCSRSHIGGELGFEACSSQPEPTLSLPPLCIHVSLQSPCSSERLPGIFPIGQIRQLRLNELAQ